MECRLAVAAKGDHVKGLAAFLHRFELCFKQLAHLRGSGEAGRSRALGVEARLAIEAVKRADFAVAGREIHAQRRPKPAAVYRSENRVVEKYALHSGEFGKRGANATHGFANVVVAGGVAQANVARGAEGRAVNGGHVSLVEHVKR